MQEPKGLDAGDHRIQAASHILAVGPGLVCAVSYAGAQPR